MQQTTLAHTIAADLRQMIDRGAYSPGEAIRQDAIAKQFAVSRIPVREALRLLEQEGVVVVHANRGAFVVEHDATTVAELFDLRLMLESDLLRRACTRLNEGAIDRLRLVNRQASRTKDKHEWIRLDEEFHFTIYSAAGRSRTFELALTLRRSLNVYYLRYLAPRDRHRAWREEHDHLLDCLERGDADGAAAELQSHLRATERLLVDALRRPPVSAAARRR